MIGIRFFMASLLVAAVGISAPSFAQSTTQAAGQAVCRTLAVKYMELQAQSTTEGCGRGFDTESRMYDMCMAGKAAEVRAGIVRWESKIRSCRAEKFECEDLAKKSLAEATSVDGCNPPFKWHVKDANHYRNVCMREGSASYRESMNTLVASMNSCRERVHQCAAAVGALKKLGSESNGLGCGRQSTDEAALMRSCQSQGPERIAEYAAKLADKVDVCRIKRNFCDTYATAADKLRSVNAGSVCSLKWGIWSWNHDQTYNNCMGRSHGEPAQKEVEKAIDGLNQCKARLNGEVDRLKAEAKKLTDKMAGGICGRLKVCLYRTGNTLTIKVGGFEKSLDKLGAALIAAHDEIKSKMAKLKSQAEDFEGKANQVARQAQSLATQGITQAQSQLAKVKEAVTALRKAMVNHVKREVTHQEKLPRGVLKPMWSNLGPKPTSTTDDLGEVTSSPDGQLFAIRAGKLHWWSPYIWDWQPVLAATASDLTRLSVTRRGQIFSVNKAGDVHWSWLEVDHFAKTATLTRRQKVASAMADIGTDIHGHIYLIAKDGRILKRTNHAMETMPALANAVDIEGGQDGLPIVRTKDDKAFNWSGSSWQPLDGRVMALGRAADGTIIGALGQDNRPYLGTWSPGSRSFTRPDSWGLPTRKATDTGTDRPDWVTGWSATQPLAVRNGNIDALALVGATGFTPKTDGFQFPNKGWNLNQDAVQKYAIPMGPARMAAVTINDFINSKTYGLCGGMSLSAHEHQHFNVTRAARTTLPGKGKLRRHLQMAQYRTFGGSPTFYYAGQTVKWWAQKDGKKTLGEWTRGYYDIMEKAIAARRPVQLYLHYETERNLQPTENHQVLATGIRRFGNASRVELYDPNHPAWTNQHLLVVLRDNDTWINQFKGYDADNDNQRLWKTVHGFFTIAPKLKKPADGLQ